MTERNTKSNSLKNHLKIYAHRDGNGLRLPNFLKFICFTRAIIFFVFFSAVKTFVVCSEMRMLVYPGFQRFFFSVSWEGKKTSGNGGQLT